ncbi:uncharacterized protein BCR38DRAFT_461880 [Pseudomassariella vexata]|uniref:Tim17/Tim22/Tim23/Pmp24 family-domain-containing protein n=1 Tax=Pseudomassariella vexata TaxID=1141098 RepID=A0A1Y2DB85_9PEZI|nr:uncharacterized protein BCR38DRAFT_461880 [Pseudomassariella vexata]ORY55925.1 hypothetical protein BCR38DRAFT_461880 [Pseudomassariella vexata]
MAEEREGARRPRPTITREEIDQLWRDSRLSIPPLIRIPAAAVTAFSVGMSLGLAHGSTMAGLRFRAEHAHRLPTSTTGWYLYHKSKNYHLAFGGLKEGLKTGLRLSVLSVAMFCAENLFDVYRGTKDMLNTVGASLAVAGGFSLINRFSPAETARTARKGLKFGLVYGAVQDLLSLAKGRPVGYVEFVRRHIGSRTKMQDQQTI